MTLESKAIALTEPSDGDVTKDWLEKELENAQIQLGKRVHKIESDNDGNNDSDDDYGLEDHKGSPLDQLHELNDTVEALALSQEVTQWAAECNNHDPDHDYNHDPETVVLGGAIVYHDARDCEALAQILCRHDSQSSLYQQLFEKEYQPLHAYVRYLLRDFALKLANVWTSS